MRKFRIPESVNAASSTANEPTHSAWVCGRVMIVQHLSAPAAQAAATARLATIAGIWIGSAATSANRWMSDKPISGVADDDGRANGAHEERAGGVEKIERSVADDDACASRAIC